MVTLRLKEILVERGMTQKELGELTGIREATLSAILRGNILKINFVHLGTIMKALNIDDFNEVFVWRE